MVFGPGGVSRKDPPVVKYSTVSNTDAPVAIGAAVERAPRVVRALPRRISQMRKPSALRSDLLCMFN